jgi:hypothetical protein
MTNIHEKRKTSMLIDNLVYTGMNFSIAIKLIQGLMTGRKTIKRVYLLIQVISCIIQYHIKLAPLIKGMRPGHHALENHTFPSQGRISSNDV